MVGTPFSDEWVSTYSPEVRDLAEAMHRLCLAAQSEWPALCGEDLGDAAAQLAEMLDADTYGDDDEDDT